MDIIINYLDSMFANLPDTEEVQKAKSEMAAMMEDKYLELKAEGKSENEAIGTVISEFGNIDELAAELNLTSKPPAPALNAEQENPVRKVTRAEAEKYLSDTAVAAKKIAFGVVLCICSPLPVILGSGSNLGAGIGVIALLALVAIAVSIFIPTAMAISKYEYLQKEAFQLEPGAAAIFQSMQDQARPIFAKKLALGVGLILFGVIVLIAMTLLFGEESEIAVLLGVDLLLTFVAAGVYQFVRWGMPFGCFDVLLQEGDYSVSRKKNKLIDKIAGIYWPLVTAVYLAWSFMTNDWDKTWIIWPVAGVLFAAIAGVCALTNKEE